MGPADYTLGESGLKVEMIVAVDMAVVEMDSEPTRCSSIWFYI